MELLPPSDVCTSAVRIAAATVAATNQVRGEFPPLPLPTNKPKESTCQPARQVHSLWVRRSTQRNCQNTTDHVGVTTTATPTFAAASLQLASAGPATRATAVLQRGREMTSSERPRREGAFDVDRVSPALSPFTTPLSDHSVPRGVWSSAWMKGKGKWEIPEKTRRPAASCSTIPTCDIIKTMPTAESIGNVPQHDVANQTQSPIPARRAANQRMGMPASKELPRHIVPLQPGELWVKQTRNPVLPGPYSTTFTMRNMRSEVVAIPSHRRVCAPPTSFYFRPTSRINCMSEARSRNASCADVTVAGKFPRNVRTYRARGFGAASEVADWQATIETSALGVVARQLTPVVVEAWQEHVSRARHSIHNRNDGASTTGARYLEYSPHGPFRLARAFSSLDLELHYVMGQRGVVVYLATSPTLQGSLEVPRGLGASNRVCPPPPCQPLKLPLQGDRCGVVVRLLASRQGESRSIPCGVAPGLSHMGIVPDNAVGQRVSSGISRFSHLCITALLHTHLASPLSVLKTSMLHGVRVGQWQVKVSLSLSAYRSLGNLVFCRSKSSRCVMRQLDGTQLVLSCTDVSL
ncbi:hypothetical protein PR048_019381 [Dryococelus australis]|uniref:Uncharacterized protein n=1 Tax=Dryococelus australis TaxID=614101 RepID=A0ABQ9H3E0_9NEOP|nr:hypothetical protein PR048_019381 [Dryococelus australis]